MKKNPRSSSLSALVKLLGLLITLALVAAACGSDTTAEAGDETSDAEAVDEDGGDTDDDAEPEEAMEQEDTEDAGEDAEPSEDAEASEGPDDDLVIVSMSPTATEMLFAIGAGDFVVAADDNSNFPAEAPTNAELTNFPVNVEGIISFGPTLVVSSGPIEGLDAVGIENLVLPFAATFDDTYTQIEQLGAATGNIAEAAELVGQIQADIAAAVDSVEAPAEALTYYHEIDATFFSSTSQTFVGQVYGLFGLENVADAADPEGESFGFPQLTEEFLVSANPDIIFLADTKSGETVDTVSSRPGWDQLNAVVNGNIVELDDDIASRWGPRIADYVGTVAEALNSVDVAVAS